MQREEKQLEQLLEAVLSRLNDIKISIGSMIHKIETEYETINWPTFLDNFALLSSHVSHIIILQFEFTTKKLHLQLTGLHKILAHELGPPLRNLTVLPLLLSPDRDEVLCQLTEGRFPVFSHDIVPNYLRTKPDPAIEMRMQQHEQKANNLVAETALKQMAQYTKVVSHVFDMVVKAREEWEVESSSRSANQQLSSLTDTQALVAAVGMGKGLKTNMGMPGPNSGMMIPSSNMIRPPGPGSSVPSPNPMVGKAPSAIKTNIKSAAGIHPYVRNQQ